MTFSRIYAYLASGGAEGGSPHVVADVTRVLSQRRHDVGIRRVALHPSLRATIVVDGVELLLQEASDGTSTWYFVARENRSVRVDAARAVRGAPFVADLDSILLTAGWMACWPDAKEAQRPTLEERVQAFAARIGTTTSGVVDVPYVSDGAIADAVEELLATASA